MAKAAIGQGLRIVLEGVRRRFGSSVIDREQLILFHQDELHVGSGALDRPRLHIPRDSQTLRVSAITHLVQFADGNVVALAILHAGVGEIAEQQKNQDRRSPELEIGLNLARHKAPTGNPDI
jgi:hypothetical protein